MESDQIKRLVLTLVTMVLSLSVHEFAHAWMATRLGDDTPDQEERLTLAPQAHIDILGTLILPAVSVLTGGFAFFGWAKPVNFNPSRFRRGIDMHRGSALVAASGPLSNLILAVLSMGLYVALLRLGVLGSHAAPGGTAEAMKVFLIAMFTTNVGLCVFNLLPIPPLDGHHLLPRSLGSVVESIRPFSFMLLLVVMMVPALRMTLLEWPMGVLRSGILSLFGVG